MVLVQKNAFDLNRLPKYFGTNYVYVINKFFA